MPTQLSKADITAIYTRGFNKGHRKAVSTILAHVRRVEKACPFVETANELSRVIHFMLTMDDRYNAKGKKGPGR